MTSISAKQSRASRFVCPKCGSDGIYELALCVVIHRIRRWGKKGTPLEYESPEVDWESDMPYDSLAGFCRERTGATFECANCMEQFEHPARRS
jgi:predicted RNA-binding Zn-ribbon protein involved in translation (DUF1610 family)